MLKDLENSLLATKEANQTLIAPMIKSLAATLKNKPLQEGLLKRFIIRIDPAANTYKDASLVMNEVIDTINFNIDEAMAYVDKNKTELETSSLKMEMISNFADRLTTSSIFMTDIIYVGFNNTVNKEKKASMLHSIIDVSNMFKDIQEEDTLREINNVTNDTPFSYLSNILPTPAYNLVSNFNGNPFFIIGKWLRQREKERMDVLKNRIEYMRLELLILQDKGGKDIKERQAYYEKQIHIMDSELTDLAPKRRTR